MPDSELLKEIARQLSVKNPQEVKAVIGFDGFVDEVVQVVDKRYDMDHYKRVEYLADYGEKISKAAGLSLNVEMLPLKRKLGGNGPIFANSLANHGFAVTYIGALGKENIHPVFKEMEGRVKLISISDPGVTDAIEFLDGKIISCKLETLKDVNWDNLKKKVTAEVLAAMLDGSDFIGFENWTLVVRMTEIWHGIISEVFPLMKNHIRRKLFIDLADPEKRTREDVLEALRCLKVFESRFMVALGLNEKEAYEIAALLGKEPHEFSDIPEVAEYIRERIETSMVVIHPVKCACASSREGSAMVSGPYCKSPKLTTGAGDNFNAGFVLAQMLGFGLKESLLIGTANSGFYVRAARSATFQELQQFILDWSQGTLS